MVVTAVPELLAGLVSVVPDGVVTLATLRIEPDAPAVPLTTKVRLPPAGKVVIVKPLCRPATVGLAGQAVPPLAPTQVTVVAVKLATAGSTTMAPLAPLGPLLVMIRL